MKKYLATMIGTLAILGGVLGYTFAQSTIPNKGTINVDASVYHYESSSNNLISQHEGNSLCNESETFYGWHHPGYHGRGARLSDIWFPPTSDHYTHDKWNGIEVVFVEHATLQEVGSAYLVGQPTGTGTTTLRMGAQCGTSETSLTKRDVEFTVNIAGKLIPSNMAEWVEFDGERECRALQRRGVRAFWDSTKTHQRISPERVVQDIHESVRDHCCVHPESDGSEASCWSWTPPESTGE